MEFRRKMIRNLHYLKNLNNNIIDEIICCLDVKRYAKGSVILKNGDVSNRLWFIREGEVEVKVTNKIRQEDIKEDNEFRFDILNKVS